MNRDIAAPFCALPDHEVVCVGDGAEAVAMAGADDYDVVLMDVRMPGMDGLEATRRIRGRPRCPQGSPVRRRLDGAEFLEQIEECRRAGMDGHLAKPFTLEILERRRFGGGDRRAGRRPRVMRLAMDASRGLGGRGADTHGRRAVASSRQSYGASPLSATAAFLSAGAVTSYCGPSRSVVRRSLRSRTPGSMAANRRPGRPMAHALTGSAGMFGFERLATVARQFEHSVQSKASDAQELANGLAAAIEVSLLEMLDPVQDAATTAFEHTT